MKKSSKKMKKSVDKRGNRVYNNQVDYNKKELQQIVTVPLSAYFKPHLIFSLVFKQTSINLSIPKVPQINITGAKFEKYLRFVSQQSKNKYTPNIVKYNENIFLRFSIE